MVPRVKTFAWRLLRKALPTGMRAGKYSDHIKKNCIRCENQDDMHLFFTCSFAKAAWILHPWFINAEILANNYSSIAAIIHAFLNLGHPQASLINIITFLWCLWKARNDMLFSRKETKPTQVHQAMQAILKNQELVLQSDLEGPNIWQTNHSPKVLPNTQNKAFEGTTTVSNCRVYSDAA